MKEEGPKNWKWTVQRIVSFDPSWLLSTIHFDRFVALSSNYLRIKLFELWDWVNDSFVAPEGIWNISISFPQSSSFSFLLLLTNRPSRDEATLSPLFLSRVDDDEDDDEIIFWSFFGSEQSILVIFCVKLSVTISQLYFMFNIRALSCW